MASAAVTTSLEHIILNRLKQIASRCISWPFSGEHEQK